MFTTFHVLIVDDASTAVLYPNSAECDVCGRQVPTTKVDSRTARVKVFLMAVDRYYRYSNESEKAN